MDGNLAERQNRAIRAVCEYVCTDSMATAKLDTVMRILVSHNPEQELQEFLRRVGKT